jgi:murein DD-endopeptidase MepM/ murein hydrolase activator NlpD
MIPIHRQSYKSFCLMPIFIYRIRNFMSKFAIINLLLLTTLFTFTSLPISTKAATIAELNNQLSQINIDASDVTKKKNDLNSEVARINEEITKIEAIIKLSDEGIVNMDKEIQTNTVQVVKLTDDTKETLKQIQITNKTTPIENILNSKNLGEFLTEIYTVSTRHNKLRDNVKALQEATTKLESDKTAQQKIKEDSETTKNVLIITRVEREDLVKNYAGKEAEYAQKIASLKSEKNSLQQLAKQAEDKYKSGDYIAPPKTGPNPTPIRGRCSFEDGRDPGIPAGFFIDPVPGNYSLSQRFSCYHDAVDIGAGWGNRATAVATASGVVVENRSLGSGWGNYLVIRHTLPSGERVYSLYAHLASTYVRPGTNVSQGQAVGIVGSTGNSTGDHLHFSLVTQSYETVRTASCLYGAKCFDPARFISF